MAEALAFRGTELAFCADGTWWGYVDDLTIHVQPPAPDRPIANAWALRKMSVVAHVQLQDVELARSVLEIALLMIEEKDAAASGTTSVEVRP